MSANTYGLKSKRSAPPVAELRAFEDDVARLIENVKFRDIERSSSSHHTVILVYIYIYKFKVFIQVQEVIYIYIYIYILTTFVTSGG